MAMSEFSALTSPVFAETDDFAIDVNARSAPVVFRLREPKGRRFLLSEDAGNAQPLELTSRPDPSNQGVPETSAVRPWAAYLSLQGQLAAQRWNAPCEELFQELARKHPMDLVTLVESGVLTPGNLTFAAEAIGAIPIPSVARTLIPLLRHKSPMVREGALYGLSQLAPIGLSQILRDVAENDPSEAVRAAAADLLEGGE